MEGREIVIEFMEHGSAAEAIQYLEVSNHDRAILMGGKHMTLTQADADKLEFVGASFAYLAYDEKTGHIMTCRSGGNRDGQAQTAAEAYESNRHDIILLVDLLKAELDRHAERAAAKPRSWAFAGDLGSVSTADHRGAGLPLRAIRSQHRGRRWRTPGSKPNLATTGMAVATGPEDRGLLSLGCAAVPAHGWKSPWCDQNAACLGATQAGLPPKPGPCCPPWPPCLRAGHASSPQVGHQPQKPRPPAVAAVCGRVAKRRSNRGPAPDQAATAAAPRPAGRQKGSRGRQAGARPGQIRPGSR